MSDLGDVTMSKACKLRAEEVEAGETHVWYLSFADDDGFRGAVFTIAYGFTDAVLKAAELGINPGGQARGWEGERPDDWPPAPELADVPFDTLLSREEIPGATNEWPS
tara:strand:- start:776 stop:1099 length:324 start_codon:yes stop_codon:yes gene_type:complete